MTFTVTPGRSSPRNRRLWVLLGALVWLGAHTGFAAPPQRVASINLCADQLLLMLAAPGQIVSVSHLARDPEHSYFANRARPYPPNHAQLEELIALAPDLVLGSRYSDPALKAALAGLGIPFEPLPPATDLQQILRNVRHTAARLGRPEAAAIALRPLLGLPAPTPSSEAAPKALLLQPNGYTAGLDTLQHTAMQLAGWRNLAAEQGIRGFSPLDLERLLLLEPDRLLHSSFHGKAPSRARAFPRHPALVHLTGSRPPLEIPYRYWICGGPMLADAVSLLRRARP